MAFALVNVATQTLIDYDVILPKDAHRADGVYIKDLRTASANDQRACGYYEITVVPAPTVQPDQRAVRTVQLVNGDATEVWVVRSETPEENATRLDRESREANLALARAAITNNQTFIDTPNANLNNAAVLAQVKDLSRQMNAVIRSLR